MGYVAHLQRLSFYDRLRTHRNSHDLIDGVFHEIGDGWSFHKMQVLHFLLIFSPPVNLVRKKRRILMNHPALLEWFLRYVIGIVINHMKLISK